MNTLLVASLMYWDFMMDYCHNEQHDCGVRDNCNNNNVAWKLPVLTMMHHRFIFYCCEINHTNLSGATIAASQVSSVPEFSPTQRSAVRKIVLFLFCFVWRLLFFDSKAYKALIIYLNKIRSDSSQLSLFSQALSSSLSSTQIDTVQPIYLFDLFDWFRLLLVAIDIGRRLCKRSRSDTHYRHVAHESVRVTSYDEFEELKFSFFVCSYLEGDPSQLMALLSSTHQVKNRETETTYVVEFKRIEIFAVRYWRVRTAAARRRSTRWTRSSKQNWFSFLRIFICFVFVVVLYARTASQGARSTIEVGAWSRPTEV